MRELPDRPSVEYYKSGKPACWREPAEWAAEPMNLDRKGAVFVPAVAGRSDLMDLVVRLADASRAVHEVLLVLNEDRT